MATPDKTLIELETKFWQSMVNQDTETALDLLGQPALMVSAQGAIKFDHAGYRKMAEQGSMVLKAFELSEVEVVFPNDTTAILSYRVKQSVGSRGGKGGGAAKSTEQQMNDTSTWIHTGHRWQCVMHTETPADTAPVMH